MNLLEQIKQELLEYSGNITHTEFKASIEKQMYSVVKQISKGELGVALVGPPEDERDIWGSIKDHISLMKMIGIESKNIFIIEKDEEVHRKLQYAKDYNDFDYTLIKGDYLEKLEQIIKKIPKTIALADFDGTSKISSIHFKLIDLFASSNKIGCLRIVSSSRGHEDEVYDLLKDTATTMGTQYRPVGMNVDTLDAIMNSPNTPQSEIDRINNLTVKSRGSQKINIRTIPPENDILSKYAKNKGIDSIVFSYAGANGSSMSSFLFSKTDLSKIKSKLNLRVRDYEQDLKNSRKFFIKGVTTPITVLLPRSQKDNLTSQYFKIKNKIYHRVHGFICEAPK